MSKRDGRIFERDESGKLKYRKDGWKNLFYVDWLQLMYIVAIILILLSYRVSVAECKVIVETINEEPCHYCELGLTETGERNDSWIVEREPVIIT